MDKTRLRDLHDAHKLKVSDKWEIYLNEYDRIFSEYRDKPINLLEIGIQNGGSLEVWAKYFHKAQKIIGCDININCSKLIYEDPRVAIVVGDANAVETIDITLKYAKIYDIIIDDGSHRSSDIIKSFAMYFPILADGGVYIVEDLHCSYWHDFEGGLFYPFSSIAFFKRLIDIINYDHWAIDKNRLDIIKGLLSEYKICMDEGVLRHIHSIEFINSICVIKKQKSSQNELGKRLITGVFDIVEPSILKLSTSQSKPQTQKNNYWSARSIPPDEELYYRSSELADIDNIIKNLRESVNDSTKLISSLKNSVNEKRASIIDLERALEKCQEQVNIMVNSRSWKITRLPRSIINKLRQMRRITNLILSVVTRNGGLKMVLNKVLRIYRSEGIDGLRSRLIKFDTTGNNVKLKIDLQIKEQIKNNDSNLALNAKYQNKYDISATLRNRFVLIGDLKTYFLPDTSAVRINIITDSISKGSLYGGVGTALILAALLANKLNANLRIVTRTERVKSSDLDQFFSLYGIIIKNEITFHFSPLSNAENELFFTENDLFITTSWWTTAAAIKNLPNNKIIYLLQEDERMFYPFGDDRIRCEEIMRNNNIRYIVNTKLLFDHLKNDGFENITAQGFWFEPAFPASIYRPAARDVKSKRKFFFYARPNNLRNLFYLGIDVIEHAITLGILNLQDWDIIMVGSGIPPVLFCGGYAPIIYENLPWAEYATLIGKVDVGLSLMYTPHPSYPPLDLVASGAVVVTNRYANKIDLRSYSGNLICTDLDRDSLVEGLRQAVGIALDPLTREQNYRVNGLLTDWQNALEYVLMKISGDIKCS